MGERRAMTLVELVVVVVVIALIIAILTPKVSPARPRAQLVMCMSNLKSQVTSFAIYAANNGGHFPRTTAGLTSLCEQGLEARDAIAVAFAGGTPTDVAKRFYCPSNADQDPSKLWDVGGKSVWGYVLMNERGPGGAALPASFPPRRVPLQYVDSINVGHGSEVILGMDVLVTDRDTAPLSYVPKAAGLGFGTNHPTVSSVAATANVAFVDGHVESRKLVPPKGIGVKQPGGEWFWFPAD